MSVISWQLLTPIIGVSKYCTFTVTKKKAGVGHLERKGHMYKLMSQHSLKDNLLGGGVFLCMFWGASKNLHRINTPNFMLL